MSKMTDYHCTLRWKGYVVSKEKLTNEEKSIIKKDCWVKPLSFNPFQPKGSLFTRDTGYPIYQESPNYFILPRYYGLRTFGVPRENKIPIGQSISIQCHAKTLSHQKKAWKVLKKTFSPRQIHQSSMGGGNGGILSIPCGYGKTVLAIRTIARLGKRTLIVVNKEDLLYQWEEELKTFTNAKIGLIQGPTVNVDDCDVVLGMLKSLSERDYDTSMLKSFGFLIIDEAHHIAARTFCQCILRIRPRFTLGLSATPQRRDGLGYLLHEFLGPMLYQEKRDGKNTVMVKGIQLVNPSHKAYKDVYFQSYSSQRVRNSNQMENNLCECPDRTRCLIQIISTLVKQPKRKILVLGKRRHHLQILKDNLDGLLGTSYSTGFYWGMGKGKKGGKRAHRQMLEESKHCDIILGTVNIAKEALNIKALNTLVFVSNFGSDLDGLDQAVGRILRVFHKEVSPLVVDIYDKVGNFVTHYRQRCQKYYKPMKYPLYQHTVTFDTQQNYEKQALQEFLDTNETHIKEEKRKSQDMEKKEDMDMSKCYLD